MKHVNTDTVLLVCDDEGRCRDILARLFDEGFSVIGPAASASLALALAAQTAPTVALVAKPPTGRRKALELAQELMSAWGVRSWVLKEACPEGVKPSAAVHWAPRAGQLERLQRAIGEDGLGAVH